MMMIVRVLLVFVPIREKVRASLGTPQSSFSCSRRELIQRPPTGRCPESDSVALSSKWAFFIKPLSSRLRDLSGRGGTKPVRPRGGG